MLPFLADRLAARDALAKTEPIPKIASSFFLADRQAAGSVLENFPTGMAVWYVEPFFCVFNRSAMQLTGFSDRDFQQNESLWLRRVHPQDHTLISGAWKKLQTEMRKVTCDYRFLPKGLREEIWIRDVSLPWENGDGKFAGIVSVYTDISAFMAGGSQSTPDLRKIIVGLTHDVRNHIHVIGGALETLRLTGSLPVEPQKIIKPIEEINRLLRDLQEYFSPPNAQLSVANPVLMLQDVILKMRDELRRRGIHLKLVHESSLPYVRLDAREIGRAISRVLDFSVALLPEGGKLNIKAQRREIDSTQYVELQIISDSAYSLEIDEKDVFQPFLQVGKYKAGLSLALARETLYRNRGQISFRKTNFQQALFSLLLEVCSG
jgi:nitrogen-specific signal transduction histidine kinase